MSDPIQFPPQVERKRIADALKDRFEESQDALEHIDPEMLLWISNANRTLMSHDKMFIIDKFSSVARQYLVMCCALGRELLGDRWDDEAGPHYMAAAIHEFVRGSCTQCLMAHHEPELHVVEE